MGEGVIYRTVAGDTWDSIARIVYYSEYQAGRLAAANPSYCDVVVFPAGVELVVPQIRSAVTPDSIAPWDKTQNQGVGFV